MNFKQFLENEEKSSRPTKDEKLRHTALQVLQMFFPKGCTFSIDDDENITQVYYHFQPRKLLYPEVRIRDFVKPMIDFFLDNGYEIYDIDDQAYYIRIQLKMPKTAKYQWDKDKMNHWYDWEGKYKSESNEEGFIQNIIQKPDDQTLRQIYADWLEERGRPEASMLRQTNRRSFLAKVYHKSLQINKQFDGILQGKDVQGSPILFNFESLTSDLKKWKTRST